MPQTFTSAGTSINSKRLPAIYSRVRFAPGSAVFDYGCGRYTDHIRAALPRGVSYLPWDPYNKPDSVNNSTKRRLWAGIHSGRPLYILCSNVLNVIDDDEEVERIGRVLVHLADCSGGTVYVTVYEGDRSGAGRQTGPDSYQRSAPLLDYLRFFPESARIRSGMIVYEGRPIK